MFGRKQHQDDEAGPHQNPPDSGGGSGCCGGVAGGCGSGEPAPRASAEHAPGEVDPDATAEMIDRLTAERDEAIVNWQRAAADFQNFQRRAAQNEAEAHRQGVTGVLGSILPVLDTFDLALVQKPGDEASAKLLVGVRAIHSELLRALEVHGVRLVCPQPNDEFDPNKHSAITQLAVQGVQPGRVSMTMQPGYTLGDRVIRSAKVGVAPKPE